MRQYFLGLPKEIEDAARIDGCSEWEDLPNCSTNVQTCPCQLGFVHIGKLTG